MQDDSESTISSGADLHSLTCFYVELLIVLLGGLQMLHQVFTVVVSVRARVVWTEYYDSRAPVVFEWLMNIGSTISTISIGKDTSINMFKIVLL